MEIWKTLDLEGFQKYEISSKGRIRNKNTNLILKPQRTIYGYMRIVLWKNNEEQKTTAKSFFVHRLVAHVFKPIENESLFVINHVDCDRSNNNVDNLEWCTQKENNNKRRKKVHFYNSKGCYDDKGNYFNSYREAGKFYNISPNTVKRDCEGLTTRTEKYRNRASRPTFKSNI